MKKLLTTILLLFLATSCQGQNPSPEPIPRTLPVKGYDVLALAKYCQKLLDAPALPAISTLLDAFGDPMPCVEQYIAKNSRTVSDIQIDLVDATCHRNKVCPPGTPPLNDMSVMRERALRIANYTNVYPKINWWVSPYLEHDIKNVAELKTAFDTVAKACTKCKLINSPVSGASLPGIPTELHGTNKSAFSISGDGASSFDGDNLKNDGNNFQHRLAGSETTFFWWNELNLRCTGEDKFTPISQRTNRPEDWQFLMAERIINNEETLKPAPPSNCKSTRDIDGSKGEITKPTAEQYCNGVPNDGRGNKLLLILKKPGSRGDKLKILSPLGVEVGCLSYYGPYTKPGLTRWYVGSCNGGNPWQLYQDLGNEWGFARDKNGICTRFNAIRREGVYR